MSKVFFLNSMVFSIKFISGLTTEVAPATHPAPAPRQFLGWPRRAAFPHWQQRFELVNTVKQLWIKDLFDFMFSYLVSLNY